jgi:hypothetical protein
MGIEPMTDLDDLLDTLPPELRAAADEFVGSNERRELSGECPQRRTQPRPRSLVGPSVAQSEVHGLHWGADFARAAKAERQRRPETSIFWKSPHSTSREP